MTFSDVLNRALKRWWIIVIAIVISTLAFFPWSTDTLFKASIGIGVSLNSPELEKRDNVRTDFSGSLVELGKYLETRFTSIEVQSLVASRAGIAVSSYSPTKAFYTVTPGSGGYISISYDAKNKDEANSFLTAIKSVYNDVVTLEKFNSETPSLSIKPKTNFIETVAQSSRPTQTQVLPSVVGFLIGLLVAVLIPVKKEKTSK